MEIWGEEGSGKSELLLNTIAHCVLPKYWKGVWVGGQGVQIVVISTDYKLDLLRLEAVVEGQLSCMADRESVDSASQWLDSTKELLTTAFSGIHVLHCHSSHQLTVTLYSLKQLLHSHPEVSLIVLDNAGAFYWIDRAEAGQYQERVSGTPRWVKVLRELVVDHQLVLCAARPVLFPRRLEQVQLYSNYTIIILVLDIDRRMLTFIFGCYTVAFVRAHTMCT